MGTFNKIVISLVAILAIATAVISYFLFEKRQQFVKGSEKFGTTIGAAVKTLDAKSGTNVKSSVNPASLHHSKYDELEGNLSQFSKQVKKYAAQRDALANTVMALSKDLELDAKFSAKNFSNIKKYAKLKAEVEKVGAATAKRNDNVYASYLNTAKNLGYTGISERKLKSGNYQSELSKVSTKAKDVKERQDKYANSIKTIAQSIGIENPDLFQSDYAASLKTVEAESKKLYVTYKNTRENLNKANTNIDALTKEKDNLSGTVEAQKIEIEKLQKQVNALAGVDANKSNIVWVPGSPNVLQRAKGKVIEVNKKWNYVVIDIGYDTTVVQKINGKPYNIQTMLKPKYSLVVARNMVKDPKNAYVGKINLTKVDPYCSIADIDPDTIKEIKVGDTVFFSDKFINDLKAKTLKEAKARVDAAIKKSQESNQGLKVEVPKGLDEEDESKEEKKEKEDSEFDIDDNDF